MSDKPEFFGFLVDETLKLQADGESKLSTLEHKLTDYGLKFVRGSFIPQLQVLRFTGSFGNLDIPINWSLFESNGYTLLDAENDHDFFFTVMKSALEYPMENLLVMHADGFCYLVAFKKGEDVYLRDLVNQEEWLKSA